MPGAAARKKYFVPGFSPIMLAVWKQPTGVSTTLGQLGVSPYWSTPVTAVFGVHHSTVAVVSVTGCTRTFSTVTGVFTARRRNGPMVDACGPLPKSGEWMDGVKSFFGVALLAAAGLFLKDAFPGLRALFSPARDASLIAAAVAAFGVLLGALHGTFAGSLRDHLLKGAGVALTVVGTVYALGATNTRQAAADTELPWMVNQEVEALQLARAEHRPVIIDFWGDWCAACKELDHTAWSDPAVQAEARRFVRLKIDNSADRIADPAVAAGGCRIHTQHGMVDADLGTQLDRIVAELLPEAFTPDHLL